MTIAPQHAPAGNASETSQTTFDPMRAKSHVANVLLAMGGPMYSTHGIFTVSDRYRVEARLGRNQLLLNRTYHADALSASGSRTYREQLRCPSERTKGVLTLVMINEHGQVRQPPVP